MTDTFVASSGVNPATGEFPDSSMKLTVAPLVNPVPVIVSDCDVLPVMGPLDELSDVIVGIVGDQTQLFMVMELPQYVTHCTFNGGDTVLAG